MAIQIRRGNYSDFDPSKMVAGEFAVCLDNGYVYITLSAGNVLRLGTAETIDEALETALGYVESCENYYDSIVLMDANVTQNTADTKTYKEEAQGYRNEMSQLIEDNISNVYIDWTTGNLMYSGGSLTLYTDTNGFLHWGRE